MTDDLMAKEYCLKAIKKGNKMAEAMKYLFEWGIKNEKEKSFPLFVECMEEDPNFQYKETSYAIFFVGRSYDMGIGVEKNTQKAIHYYEIALGKNNPGAMVNLASIYEDGQDDVPIDINKSIQLLKRAIKLGFFYFFS